MAAAVSNGAPYHAPSPGSLYGSRERIAGTIYGTVVVLGVLAAGSETSTIDAWQLDVIMVATVVVLWIAHVYAHAHRRESSTRARRLQWSRRSRLAGQRASSRSCSRPFFPALALLLGAVGVLADANAVPGWPSAPGQP